jgi:hypothetical protein
MLLPTEETTLALSRLTIGTRLAPHGPCFASAEKHAIALQRIEVDAKALRNEEDGINSIERQVRLIGDLNDSDGAKFESVAERTPVTLAIKDGLAMTTGRENTVDTEDLSR